MDQFKALCEQFMSITAEEPKCVYYGFSFNADNVHCREAYDDAEGLLTHLTHVGAVLNEALKISQITRLEVHGIAEELERVKEPLAHLGPSYFVLAYGIRR